MNVIITDGWLARHGPVSLDHRQVALTLVTFAAFICTFTVAVYTSVARLNDAPATPKVTESVVKGQAARDALAKRVGELQARMGNVDTKIRTLANTIGLFPADFMPNDGDHKASNVKPAAESPVSYNHNGHDDHVSLSELDRQNPLVGISLKIPSAAPPLAQLFRASSNPTARGGLLLNPHALSDNDLSNLINTLEIAVGQQEDQLSLTQSRWVERTMNKSMPSSTPVDAEFGSSFGWRIDPFTGRYALHNGQDFAAPMGAPVKASAQGVVVTSEWAGGYGRMVEIDHGNDIHTRYAHLSQTHVEVGDKVEKGQVIANVGNTGRSTGPHLHFEVRVEDTPVNPVRFLQNHIQQARR